MPNLETSKYFETMFIKLTDWMITCVHLKNKFNISKSIWVTYDSVQQALLHRKLEIRDKQKLGLDADLHAENDNELGNVVVGMGAI